MSIEISPAQRWAMIGAIAALRLEKGAAPALSEIATRLGVSRLKAFDTLVALREGGWITQGPVAIEVVQRVPCRADLDDLDADELDQLIADATAARAAKGV